MTTKSKIDVKMIAQTNPRISRHHFATLPPLARSLYVTDTILASSCATRSLFDEVEDISLQIAMRKIPDDRLTFDESKR